MVLAGDRPPRYGEKTVRVTVARGPVPRHRSRTRNSTLAGACPALRVLVFGDNSAVEASLSLPCRSQRFINNLLSQTRSVF